VLVIYELRILNLHYKNISSEPSGS